VIKTKIKEGPSEKGVAGSLLNDLNMESETAPYTI